MLETRVTLSALWAAVMLTFLLGDVLRIFAGDFVTGEMNGKPVGRGIWLVAALVMLVPIVMVVLSIVVPYPAIRWLSMGVAVLVVAFNALGLPYRGSYDNLLIAVSFVFCALVIWYAWRWV
jgi:hypothetical protein